MNVALAPSITVDAVLAGKVVDYTRPGSRSAIDKQPLRGRVMIGLEGLLDDEQGDRRVHGGPDKAVHHYPHDHYAAWQAELGGHPLLAVPGAFGENFSGSGLVEADVCLGDRFAIGSVVLEVSQLRQPCWKLSDRFGVPDMARRVQATGRTGWYYRVLQAGGIEAGQALTLVERAYPQWSLTRIADVLYRRGVDAELIRELLELPLVPSWRTLFERRLEQGLIESWSKRLEGRSDG